MNNLEINKIYLGDNLEILKTFPDNTIDLIITSPNYNNWRNKRTQANRKEYWDRTNIVYDNCVDKQDDTIYEANQIEMINEMIRILKPTGTTTKVAYQMKRNYIGIDNSENYNNIAEQRIKEIL